MTAENANAGILVVNSTEVDTNTTIVIYGVLRCLATAEGETPDGISYSVSGICRQVRRHLRALGVI